MSPRSTRIVVITEPDQLDQDWINRLASEPDIDVIDRVGLLNIGLERVQQLKPDIAIIERSTDQVEAAIRKLFLSLPTTLCIAIVVNADIPTVRRLVGAGARDVLAQPVEYDDLIAGLRATIAAEEERRSTSITSYEEAPVQRNRGRLIAVTSPKGGVGTTTIATNLAVALRKLTNARILLADFDLQFGDVGVLLNVRSKHTVRDLFPRIYDIDDNLLSAVIQPHNSGIDVLLAPDAPDAAGEIDASAFKALLESLVERYDYVVCDTWCFVDDLNVTLVENANEVLVVTTPEVPALKNAKQMLDHLSRHNDVAGRITLVLNRFPSVNGISLEDVQQNLRYQIGATVPSEGQFVTNSVNRGIPVVVAQPQSWVAQSLAKLAAYIAGDSVNTISLEREVSGKSSRPKEAINKLRERRVFGRLVRS